MTVASARLRYVSAFKRIESQHFLMCSAFGTALSEGKVVDSLAHVAWALLWDFFGFFRL